MLHGESIVTTHSVQERERDVSVLVCTTSPKKNTQQCLHEKAKHVQSRVHRHQNHISLAIIAKVEKHTPSNPSHDFRNEGQNLRRGEKHAD